MTICSANFINGHVLLFDIAEPAVLDAHGKDQGSNSYEGQGRGEAVRRRSKSLSKDGNISSGLEALAVVVMVRLATKGVDNTLSVSSGSETELVSGESANDLPCSAARVEGFDFVGPDSELADIKTVTSTVTDSFDLTLAAHCIKLILNLNQDNLATFVNKVGEHFPFIAGKAVPFR